MKIMRIISYILLLVLIILAVTFAASNASAVPLHYYWGTITISLSLLLVYVLGIGIILGFIANLLPFLKLKRENRSLRGRLKKIENLAPATPKL